MLGKTVVCLVMALALTGCSDRSSGRGGQGGAPRTPAPSPSGPTATAVSGVATVCRTVETAAYNQLLAAALAVGDKEKENSVVRADVAETYRDFADQLSLIAPRAPGNLRPPLLEWASAGVAVARFVAGTKPRAGIVIDFGPANKRWEAARRAAEKICGHELPDLDQ